jgi:tRNA(Ile)-lysidine synthase
LVPFPLELRKVKPTDKFKPLGMKNHKKIHKFLKDEGIPTSLKKETWVVAHQNTVLWVVNQRINDDFKITSNTKQCLELSTSLLPIS